jgi:hypothetical protein
LTDTERQFFIWSFLRGGTGWNYAAGSFSYFRGIVRFEHFKYRAIGIYGENEQAQVVVEAVVVAELVKRVPPIAKFIHKHRGNIVAAVKECLADSGCRAVLVDVANAVASKTNSTEHAQRFAGRAATGVLVTYFVGRAGGGRSGSLFGAAAVVGDATWKISQGSRSLEDLLNAVLYGK